MPSRHYRLTMRKGPMPGKMYDLAKSMLTLGREVKNDIVINDAEVSRLHLRLNETANGYQVEDQASTNGTFINGQRLSAAPALLRTGDILGLGETIELEYAEISEPEATVLAAQNPPATAPAASPMIEPAPAGPVVEPAPVPSAPLPSIPNYTPPPAMSIPAAPAYTPSAPEAKPANNWWMWAVGIGCSCLALAACLVGAGLLAYFVMSNGRF